MEQHPVPQHISSYEFKLVGDMTLKQFFQLGGGVLIALLFYAAALPDFIKWPLILFFSLSGAALAFFPFEERPLSAWIFAFFKAVYSPTRYVWTKGKAEETFPKEETPQPTQSSTSPEPAPQPFNFAQDKPEEVSKLEKNEASFVQKVTEMFQVTPVQGGAGQALRTPPQRVVLQVEETQDKPFDFAQGKPAPIIPHIEPIKIETAASVTPVFTSQETPPSPPQIPNTIAGQVLDTDGRIIDSAILEIRDSNNLPVRALKSNKAGHFLTVTPLPDGEYIITTEKEGFNFTPVKFVAAGQIIAPILIRSK